MIIKNTSKIALAAVMVFAGTVSFAQKKTETDAALAFQSFESSFASGDMVNAKKSLLKAKGYIDQAAVNAETQASPKTLFYKGEIYASGQLLRMMNDAEFNTQFPENSMTIAVEAYNKSYTTSGKFKSQIEQSVNNITGMIEMQAKPLFDGGKYSEAGQLYANAAEVGGAINKVDTVFYYYAAIAYQNAKDWDNTAKYYRKCAEMNYKPEETYLNAATAYISAKKEEEAMAFLDGAISKAPKDKALYYVLGTIYMDKNDDAKVSEYLGKAIEIDPKYSDALFNLGSYYFTKGMDIRRKANDEPVKAKQDELLKESLVYLEKAMPALESYIAIEPTDKEVVKSLWQMSKAFKNTEKETKYKAMYDAMK